MIYTEKTKRALKLMFEAHKDQTDKAGLPYVFHPFHLAEQMTGEAETVAALLHDVAEDTDITLDELRGFDRSYVSDTRSAILKGIAARLGCRGDYLTPGAHTEGVDAPSVRSVAN